VQTREDITNTTAMNLDANARILRSVESFYSNLMKITEFELYSSLRCQRAVAELSAQLRIFINETEMHCARAKTLGKIMADRKALVRTLNSISSMKSLKVKSRKTNIAGRLPSICRQGRQTEWNI
jgi:hypothetical protein